MGFIQDEDCIEGSARLNIGYIPDDFIEYVVACASSSLESFREDLYDALDNREDAGDKEEWDKWQEKAESAFDSVEKFMLYFGAVDWNDGLFTSFNFWNWDDNADLFSDEDFQGVIKRLEWRYEDQEIRNMKPNDDGSYCY